MLPLARTYMGNCSLCHKCLYRIWCGLVNSFVPGTFTTEVTPNDRYICSIVIIITLYSCRWFINLALDAATRMFKINCSVDSEDLCLVGIHSQCYVLRTDLNTLSVILGFLAFMNTHIY